MSSKEYSKCIEKYLQQTDRFVTFVFGEIGEKSGKEKVVQKGVYCKMARGEMVRYLAGIGAKEPEQAKGFNWSGYRFDDGRSDDETYYFIREIVPGK